MTGKKSVLVLAAAAICLMAVSAGAVEPDAETPVIGSDESLAPSLLRLVLAMVAVIVLFYLAFVLIRRLSRRRGLGGAQTMHILEVLPLGPKAKLVAVKQGDKVLLVGAGDNSVNKIDELPLQSYEILSGQSGKPVIPFKERLLALARK